MQRRGRHRDGSGEARNLFSNFLVVDWDVFFLGLGYLLDSLLRDYIQPHAGSEECVGYDVSRGAADHGLVICTEVP